MLIRCQPKWKSGMKRFILVHRLWGQKPKAALTLTCLIYHRDARNHTYKFKNQRRQPSKLSSGSSNAFLGVVTVFLDVHLPDFSPPSCTLWVTEHSWVVDGLPLDFQYVMPVTFED